MLLFVAFNVEASLRFSTYNIRMFDSKKLQTNLVELKKIIHNLDTDFLTVQEIVDTRGFQNFILKNFKEYKVSLSTCGGMGRQKIGFVYNKSKFKLIRVYEDKRISDFDRNTSDRCGRLRPALVGVFQLRLTGEKFVALGLHLKAGGGLKNYRKRAKQYREINTIINELKAKVSKNIILMGDFNTTGFIDRDMDYRNFDHMLSDAYMHTISERLNCTSYWSGENSQDNIEESSILDHIVHPIAFLGQKRAHSEVHTHCKKVMCNNVSASELGTSYKSVSDHCPITTTFK